MAAMRQDGYKPVAAVQSVEPTPLLSVGVSL